MDVGGVPSRLFDTSSYPLLTHMRVAYGRVNWDDFVVELDQQTINNLLAIYRDCDSYRKMLESLKPGMKVMIVDGDSMTPVTYNGLIKGTTFVEVLTYDDAINKAAEWLEDDLLDGYGGFSLTTIYYLVAFRLALMDGDMSDEERFAAAFNAAKMALVDENGAPLLVEDDRAAIRAASFLPLYRIFGAARALNELDVRGEEERVLGAAAALGERGREAVDVVGRVERLCGGEPIEEDFGAFFREISRERFRARFGVVEERAPRVGVVFEFGEEGSRAEVGERAVRRVRVVRRGVVERFAVAFDERAERVDFFSRGASTFGTREIDAFELSADRERGEPGADVERSVVDLGRDFVEFSRGEGWERAFEERVGGVERGGDGILPHGAPLRAHRVVVGQRLVCERHDRGRDESGEFRNAEHHVGTSFR
ncbi:MAG: hypothetical protein II655_08525, partial [Thermoguttaceae bacterium]|nr:hypothetical protein [Thermoguttaceae bacterium]